jgi:uncharacterized membrane protein
VKVVRQLDDMHLEWTAEIGGEHSWQAEISQQEPDRLISWRALDGKYNSGKVTFEPLEANRTRINVEMTYDAEGWKESVGSALGLDSRRVSGDLDRFKEFIEAARWRPAPGAGKSTKVKLQIGSAGKTTGKTPQSHRRGNKRTDGQAESAFWASWSLSGSCSRSCSGTGGSA